MTRARAYECVVGGALVLAFPRISEGGKLDVMIGGLEPSSDVLETRLSALYGWVQSGYRGPMPSGWSVAE